MHNGEVTRTRAHTYTQTEVLDWHSTARHTDTHSDEQPVAPESLAAQIDFCTFANVNRVTVNNNKDEAGIKSVNILTNALSTL